MACCFSCCNGPRAQLGFALPKNQGSCSATRISCSKEATASVVELLSDLKEQLQKSPSSIRPGVAEKLSAISKELAAYEDDDFSDLCPAERIKQGFLKFKRGTYLKKPAVFKKLAEAQNPKFMIVACCDSRVCPTTILGLQPGEAFIARNIANLIPPWEEAGYPETRAALEFSVLQLKVENILVMGHSRCGGIRALMTQKDHGWSEFIENWIRVARPAKSAVETDVASEQELEHQCTHCEKESIKLTLRNLLTFPWIKDAVSSGTLALHGGYYDFVDGSFEYWSVDMQGSVSHVSKL